MRRWQLVRWEAGKPVILASFGDKRDALKARTAAKKLDVKPMTYEIRG
jgi:hypothetical protein